MGELDAEPVEVVEPWWSFQPFFCHSGLDPESPFANQPHRSAHCVRCADGYGAPQAEIGYWRTASGPLGGSIGCSCAAIWRRWVVFRTMPSVISPELAPCHFDRALSFAISTERERVEKSV